MEVDDSLGTRSVYLITRKSIVSRKILKTYLSGGPICKTYVLFLVHKDRFNLDQSILNTVKKKVVYV